MAADPSPEIATTPEWRSLMVATRKLKGMDQRQLGARVGTSQNIISLIERGKLGSSSFILPICKVLRIPVPMHFISKAQQRWSLVGHLLDEDHKDQFESALKLFESLVAEKLKKLAEAGEDAEPKLRPVASADAVVPPPRHGAQRSLRPADESPVDAIERKKKR